MDYIKITYSYAGKTTVSVAIADFNGQILMTIDNVKSGDKISVANLPKGYYSLKVPTLSLRRNINHINWLLLEESGGSTFRHNLTGA